MTIRALFPTLVLKQPLETRGQSRLNQDLADECRSLAASDATGRRWSADNYPGGYTSYGSLDRMHLVSSLFARLRRLIDPQVRSFARALHYDLRGRTLGMTDCWANVMPAGVMHSFHLHPISFISGTYYVEVPKGAGALKFEDPRLALHMAAPPRRADAPEAFRPFVSLPARPGDLVLFESWLRHEVPPARFSGERISISFNYGWTARVRR
ncbi:TIGR02466 family protein [Reyranella sp.]|uniref:TIGR02466 family protein n=1 Tax=Reyranella sp. TaxID=1929291 RepID=UPI003BAD502D